MQMELYFYLVMETTAAIPDEIDPIALKYTATLISLELMKKQALIEKEQQVGGELLSNLLEKRYDDEEVIIRRGAMLHFNLSLPLVVFTINVSHTECKAEDYEKCNVMLGEAKKNLRERLHWQMLNAGKGLIMLEKSDSIVGLLEVEPSDSIHGIQKMLCTTLEKMNQKFPRIKLIAGIGRIYRGLSSIPTSYKESLAAAKVGMSIQEYETTVVFEELGVYRILWELKESTAMGSFYTENLKQLIDYDSKNKAELVKTIDTYYKNNGNLEKTADMLFIHKNTVSYRLRKAEAIIGKKLSDYSVILDLQLCLKFKNFL
jgi:purine catabolism regulator